MGCLLSRLRRAGSLGLALIALALALTLLAPAFLGYSRYVITGESMAGSYDRGSLVFAREVPVAELEAGDVITYVPPRNEALVTHRVVKISEGPHGERVFRTKGDANEHRDPWTFVLDHPLQARVEAGIPYLGFPIAALSIHEVRMGVIGGPALLVAVALILRLWRESGRPQAPTRKAAQPSVS